MAQSLKLKFMKTTKIALFKGRKIRKTLYKNEWFFVSNDVIVALTDSVQPGGYIKDMRRRDPELSKGWVQIASLVVQTEGGAGLRSLGFRKINEHLTSCPATRIR